MVEGRAIPLLSATDRTGSCGQNSHQRPQARAAWHLRQVWAPLLFEDEQLPGDRQRRHPILPATSSESAQAKKSAKQTTDGLPVHSFATLLGELASRARVTYSLKADSSSPTFQQLPPPSPLQAKAYELLNLLPVAGN